MFAFTSSSSSNNKKQQQRALKEIEIRRGRIETYVDPLPNNDPDMKEFLLHFYRHILFHRTMITEECNLYPHTVQYHYHELVLQQKIISHEDFWQRYFYRTSSIERVVVELEQLDQESKQQQQQQQDSSSGSSYTTRLSSWRMSSSNHPPPKISSDSSANISTTDKKLNPHVDLIPQRVLSTEAGTELSSRSSSSTAAAPKISFLDLLPRRKSTSNDSNKSSIISTTTSENNNNVIPVRGSSLIRAVTPPLILKLDDTMENNPLLLVDFPKPKNASATTVVLSPETTVQDSVAVLSSSIPVVVGNATTTIVTDSTTISTETVVPTINDTNSSSDFDDDTPVLHHDVRIHVNNDVDTVEVVPANMPISSSGIRIVPVSNEVVGSCNVPNWTDDDPATAAVDSIRRRETAGNEDLSRIVEEEETLVTGPETASTTIHDIENRDTDFTMISDEIFRSIPMDETSVTSTNSIDVLVSQSNNGAPDIVPYQDMDPIHSFDTTSSNIERLVEPNDERHVTPDVSSAIVADHNPISLSMNKCDHTVDGHEGRIVESNVTSVGVTSISVANVSPLKQDSVSVSSVVMKVDLRTTNEPSTTNEATSAIFKNVHGTTAVSVHLNELVISETKSDVVESDLQHKAILKPNADPLEEPSSNELTNSLPVLCESSKDSLGNVLENEAVLPESMKSADVIPGHLFDFRKQDEDTPSTLINFQEIPPTVAKVDSESISKSTAKPTIDSAQQLLVDFASSDGSNSGKSSQEHLVSTEGEDSTYRTPPGQVSFEVKPCLLTNSGIDAAFTVMNPFDAVLKSQVTNAETMTSFNETIDCMPLTPDAFQSWEGSPTNNDGFSAPDVTPERISTSDELHGAFDPFFVEAAVEKVVTKPTFTSDETQESVAIPRDFTLPLLEQTEKDWPEKSSSFRGLANFFKNGSVAHAQNSKDFGSMDGASLVSSISNESDLLKTSLDRPDQVKNQSDERRGIGSSVSLMNVFKLGIPESMKSEKGLQHRSISTSTTEAKGEPAVPRTRNTDAFSKVKDEKNTDIPIGIAALGGIFKPKPVDGSEQPSVDASASVEREVQPSSLGTRFNKMFASKKRKQSMDFESPDVPDVTEGFPSPKLAKFVSSDGSNIVQENQSKFENKRKMGNFLGIFGIDTTSEAVLGVPPTVPNESKGKHVVVDALLSEGQPVELFQSGEDLQHIATGTAMVRRGLGNIFKSISRKDYHEVAKSEDAETKEQKNAAVNLESSLFRNLTNQETDDTVEENNVTNEISVADSRAATPVTSNVDLTSLDRFNDTGIHGGIRTEANPKIFRYVMVVICGIFIAMIVPKFQFLISESMVDQLCGPVMPGWTSMRSYGNVAAEAPYWVPTNWKPFAFRRVCGVDRTRTILKWTQHKNGEFNFEILPAGNEKQVPLIKKKRVRSVQIYSDNIEVTHIRGKTERFRPLWIRQR
jgi:hypothetical protein